MSSAGQLLVAGRIPGERIATDIEVADSATFTTTEATVMSVTAPLVIGRTYMVRAYAKFEAVTEPSAATVRLRLTNVAGATIQIGRVYMPNATSFGWPASIEAEYTAGATGNQVFVLTGLRVLGASTVNLVGGAVNPSYLYVDYISG